MIPQQLNEIGHDVLLQSVIEMKENGYRLVQMCATKTEDGFELSYSFALEETFVTLRMQIAEDTVVPSISAIFAPAFLYENEMADLFGVKIEHISIDYKGTLYRTGIKTPFNPQNS